MIEKDEAIELLEPHLSTIDQVVRDAWAGWMASNHPSNWTKRGRANFMWEEINTKAKQAFASSEAIKPIPANNSCLYMLDKLAFRFKKLNDNGLTCNYPTQASLDFHAQSELPGIPEVARLEVGYLLNKIQTKIDEVIISYRESDSVEWSIKLSDHLNTSNVVPMEHNNEQVNEANTERAPKLVKVKAPAKEAKSSEERK